MKTSLKHNLLAAPIHPLFFAVSGILSLYLANIREAYLSDILAPTAFVLAVTVVVFIPAALVLKSSRKAAIIISLSLMLCLSFGEMTAVLIGWWNIGVKTVAGGLLAMCSVLLVVSTCVTVRSRGDMFKATVFVNLLGLVFILVPVVSIVTHDARVWAPGSEPGQLRQEAMVGDTTRAPVCPADPPDIYYIILDRYPSNATLQEFYNFDNSAFTDYLREKGFYVASRSKSNYARTAFSLASSLNMDYLRLSGHIPKGHSPFHALYQILREHKAGRTLKSLGYSYVHAGSIWAPTSDSHFADVKINYRWMSEFSMAVLRSTALYPVLALCDLDRRAEHRQRVLYKFQRLGEVPKMKGPVFVFAHFLMPHPPFIFDGNGNPVSRGQEAGRSRKVNFVEQVRIYSPC